MADLDRFVKRMIYWCEEADLGYDQWNRQDFRNGGESDCSSLVIHALQEAGFDTGSATYTGNMSYNLTSRGWKRIPNNGNPQNGDILLNDVNHVGVYINSNGWRGVAQASGDESGNIHGGQGGDQTGYETFITNGYYNYPWDCYLRYEGAQSSVKEDFDVDIKYALRTADNNEWLETVNNFNNYNDDGYAGWTGKEHNGFRAKVSKGSIKYQVHIIDGSWSDWYYDGDAFTTDGVIDGISLYYTTPSGMDYQQAWYRSTTVNHPSYLDVCCDDGEDNPAYDGWCGLYGQPLDQIQICINNYNPF